MPVVAHWPAAVADATMGPPALPPLFHLGWVVRDRDATIEDLSARLGAGPFQVLAETSRFERALVRGRPGPFELRIAFGLLGGVVLELLEPLDAASPHAEFLASHGEGLHHLAYLVPDLDAALRDATAATPPLELLVDGTGADNPIRWAYLEGGAAHGTVVELIERSPVAEAAFADVLALLELGR